jgi:hypothetical protein
VFDFGIARVEKFLRRDGGGWLVIFRGGQYGWTIWNFIDERNTFIQSGRNP